MKNKYFIIGAVLIFSLAICVTWAMAQEDGTILACAAKDGTLRLIADPAECKDKETPVSWYSGGAMDLRLSELEDRLSSLESENLALKERVDDLESLLVHFSRDGDEITITGANLNVVNGTGTTDGTPNGLGNVIIGYNNVFVHPPFPRPNEQARIC